MTTPPSVLEAGRKELREMTVPSRMLTLDEFDRVFRAMLREWFADRIKRDERERADVEEPPSLYDLQDELAGDDHVTPANTSDVSC